MPRRPAKSRPPGPGARARPGGPTAARARRPPLASLATASLAALAACAWLGRPEPAFFRMPPANTGPERYSAWFADSDGEVLYFGLSAFWSAQWQAGGDPTADLAQPGDQLIGRFDLARERFLPPLRAREAGPEVRSSVWDVLVHSNGRIYYTTFYEPMGWIRPGGASQVFPDLGTGLNELAEGPRGRIYVTRYAGTPSGAGAPRGSVLVLDPDGRPLRELVVPPLPGTTLAAKSLAVDPGSGEIWLNTDTFGARGEITHETLRLTADGEVRARQRGDPEGLFARFDPLGQLWVAERAGDRLRLRVLDGDRAIATADLGPLAPHDFAQDLHFGPEGRAVIALWGGRVHLAELRGHALHTRLLRFPEPDGCEWTGGPSLLYTAVLHARALYATRYCGPLITRLPLR